MINNKGFMLAEVVIVSAILITTLTSLYIGFAKVYKAYEERSNFFDVDSIYALKNIEDELIDEGVFNTIINDIKNNEYVFYDQKNLLNDSYTNIYLRTIMENYSIEYFYITKYNENNLNTIINLDSDNIVLNDFLSYLNKNLDFSINYNYIFISKTKDGKFAFLRVV